MSGRPSCDVSDEAGFTLIEALIATALMTIILAALATVTTQWLPNWNRGMARVQSDERLALGLDRIVADLSAAEMVPLNAGSKVPVFEGAQLSVTLVRTVVGPNNRPGLEFVRIAERPSDQGLAVVRERSPFVPMTSGMPINFADPVVLMRAPYRISFSYAGRDQVWQPAWRDPMLPSTIRVSVRNASTQQVLAVSTAAVVHVNASAECINTNDMLQCLAGPQSPEARVGAASNRP